MLCFTSSGKKKVFTFLSKFKSERSAESLVLLPRYPTLDMSKDLIVSVLVRVVVGNNTSKLGHLKRVQQRYSFSEMQVGSMKAMGSQ